MWFDISRLTTTNTLRNILFLNMLNGENYEPSLTSFTRLTTTQAPITPKRPRNVVVRILKLSLPIYKSIPPIPSLFYSMWDFDKHPILLFHSSMWDLLLPPTFNLLNIETLD